MHPTPLRPRRRDRVLSWALSLLERAVDALQAAPRRSAAPQRIVVLKSCCLGDLLLTTPLLGALRRAYPTARIMVGVGRWSRPALHHNPDVDGLLDLETVAVRRFQPSAYARAVRRLRAGRFDLALVLDRTPLMTALPLLAGIPVRAGLDSAGRGFPLNVRVPWLEVEHEADLFLRVGATLGVATEGARPVFAPTGDERDRAAALWREAGLDGRRAVALLPGGGRNPGMTLEAKRWPTERFAALADALHREHGLRAVLLGSDDDRPVTAAVRRLMRAPAVDLVGKTPDFGVLGALLARCALFVGNDSGPMHLAAAVGIPVVAVFGPTDPAVYGPYSSRAIALRGPDGQSTDEVSVDDVALAAARLLEA